MRKIVSLLLFVVCASLSAQTLIPYPQRVKWEKGWSRANIPVNERKLLNMTAKGPATPRGFYSITVLDDEVLVGYTNEDSRLYARTTLKQLSDGKGRYAKCHVEDWPEMEWRGAMIDVSRHFFPIETLYKQIDILSRFKINRLHLHLTDAAGWRMEIKRYPRLTSLAAWRTSDSWKTWWNDGKRAYAEEGSSEAHGGYYTQDELRDLVKYAEGRGIEIIPEIEMPAHSEEVLTAYPELSCTHEPYKQADFCAGSAATVDFLENILREVMDVFPSHYIHVGGDEAGRASWKTCPLCQTKMKELGTDDTRDLQAWLINHFAEFLAKNGRQLVGWDEIIEVKNEKFKLKSAGDILPVVMAWRGKEKGIEAARQGLDVVLAPGTHCYLDFYQDAPPTEPEAIGGYTPLDKVRDFHPLEGFSVTEKINLKGIQGNVWTEYVPSPEQLEYMLYPRILALAEIGWLGKNADEAKLTFRQRAEAQCDKLRKEGVNAFDLRHEKGERAAVKVPVAHKARGCKVTYNQPYSEHYAAAGEGSLTDGVCGGWANNDGRWQGFIKGFDVVVDLGKSQKITKVSTDFMQMCGPEIYWPTEYVIHTSPDGKNWTEMGRDTRTVVKTTNPEVQTRSVKNSTTTRYIRVTASPSFNGWIFCDEIKVE